MSTRRQILSGFVSVPVAAALPALPVVESAKFKDAQRAYRYWRAQAVEYVVMSPADWKDLSIDYWSP